MFACVVESTDDDNVDVTIDVTGYDVTAAGFDDFVADEVTEVIRSDALVTYDVTAGGFDDVMVEEDSNAGVTEVTEVTWSDALVTDVIAGGFDDAMAEDFDADVTEVTRSDDVAEYDVTMGGFDDIMAENPNVEVTEVMEVMEVTVSDALVTYDVNNGDFDDVMEKGSSDVTMCDCDVLPCGDVVTEDLRDAVTPDGVTEVTVVTKSAAVVNDVRCDVDMLRG